MNVEKIAELLNNAVDDMVVPWAHPSAIAARIPARRDEWLEALGGEAWLLTSSHTKVDPEATVRLDFGEFQAGERRFNGESVWLFPAKEEG